MKNSRFDSISSSKWNRAARPPILSAIAGRFDLVVIIRNGNVAEILITHYFNHVSPTDTNS